MKHSRLIRTSTILLGTIAMFGCDGITSLSENGPVGGYTATILVMTENSVPTNVLAGGGSFTMTLADDGTTSGRLHVVGSDAYPAVDADMADTWTRDGDEIHFAQAADTFVRNMTFRIEQISDGVWSLVGDDVFDATRVNVTLAHNR